MKKNGPKTSPVQCNRWLLILTFMLMSFHAGAQNKVTVSGVVSDEKGTPMVGVTVLVKNTNIGRITGKKENTVSKFRQTPYWYSPIWVTRPKRGLSARRHRST